MFMSALYNRTFFFFGFSESPNKSSRMLKPIFKRVRDACNNGDADCSDLAVCTSLFPGFTCTCPEGYQGDGKTCEIICPSDECWNYDVGKAPVTISYIRNQKVSDH